MDDIVGNDQVTLYLGTVDYPISFIFSPCTVLNNDGAIPYGTTISTVSLKAFSSSHVDYTTILDASASLDGQKVNCLFSFPTDSKIDKFSVLISLTLSNGSVLVKKWEGLQTN